MNSIRVKLSFLIFIALILPLSLYIYISQSHLEDNLLEQTRINDLKSIESIKTSIRQLIKTVELGGSLLQNDENIIHFVESSAHRAANDKKLYHNMNSTLVTKKYITNIPTKAISLIDSSGHLIGESYLNSERLQSILTKSFINKLNSDTVTWTNLYHIQETATHLVYNTIMVFFPLKNKQDILVGYAVLFIDERTLFETISMYGNEIYILDKMNAIVSCRNYNYLYQSFYNIQKLHYNRSIYYSYFVNNSTVITKSNHIRAAITTQNFDYFNWKFIKITSFDDLVKEISYNNRIIILVVLLIIIFIILSAVLLSYYFSRPIIKLKNTMQAVKQGDLNIRNQYDAKDEIGSLSSHFDTMMDKIKELTIQHHEEEQMLRTIQFQLIQSQVKPHFLYNVLEMIACFIQEGRKELSITAISTLAKFYRISLSDGTKNISIEKEFELIESYLQLQSLRYVDIIEFEIDLDKSVKNFVIPKLTLQTFIENAIYHGIRSKGGMGIIRVSAYKKNERIFFSVYDNGIGIAPEKINQILCAVHSSDISTHFGISSSIKKLGIYFNNDITFEIHSELNSYTEIIISIPKEAYRKE